MVFWHTVMTVMCEMAEAEEVFFFLLLAPGTVSLDVPRCSGVVRRFYSIVSSFLSPPNKLSKWYLGRYQKGQIKSPTM